MVLYKFGCVIIFMIYETTGQLNGMGSLILGLAGVNLGLACVYASAQKHSIRAYNRALQLREDSKQMIERLSAAGHEELAEDLKGINNRYPLPRFTCRPQI